MSSLETIRKINSLVESDKLRRLARVMNNPKGHPKDREKGRVTLADRLKKSPAGASQGLDKLRESCNLDE